MCGIFGVLGEPKSKAFDEFEKLAKLNERRGQDAFGAYLISPAEAAVSVLKCPGSATVVLKSSIYKDFKASSLSTSTDRISLVGHTRLATNGDWTVLENNQPAVYDGWVIVHNGIVINEADLKTKYLSPEYRSKELDTFGILGLIVNLFSKAPAPSIEEVLRALDTQIEGANNIAFYNASLKKLILYSSNGSLFIAKNDDRICFASEKSFLKEINDGSDATLFHLDRGIAAAWDTQLHQLTIVNYKDNNSKINTEFAPGNTRFKVFQPHPSSRQTTNTETSVLARQMMEEYEKVLRATSSIQRCPKCLLPKSFPGILIDAESCSICKTYKKNTIAYDLDALDKKLGASATPVLVSLSGGRDSSYTLHLIANELKRKVIAFTYDWGMVTDLARRNQSRLCGHLDVEHVIVSANIQKKRLNIRKNILAWLNRPSLGTIPLFMAGDKHYFYYSEMIRKELGCSNVVMGENKLEKTGFKTKFAGADQSGSDSAMAYNLSTIGKAKMLAHYGFEFAVNPGYWNSSLIDTFTGFLSYYILPHNYINVFNYVPWHEREVDLILRKYNWEFSPDCATSWRIGDGTAPFYNYIYYTVAGFSENDTLRANQLREGHITPAEAQEWINRDNKPRPESFEWYCRVLGLNATDLVKQINKIPKYYENYLL